MRLHSVCDLFPPMPADEFAALVEDIRKHGVRVPIVVHEGAIVDGRHRWLACEKLGIGHPPMVPWDGTGSLIESVVALNLHRRHLTTGQRAALATDVLPLLEAEARERRIAGLKRGTERPPVRADLRERAMGKAAAKAAGVVGVSTRSVEAAKKLKGQSPEAFEAVRSGAVSLSSAVGSSARRGEPVESWIRSTDDWTFARFDERIGRSGQRGRLPGGTHLNLLRRFLPHGGKVLSAGCGSGSMHDAAAILDAWYDIVGFDVRLDPRMAERHGAKFLQFDATERNWSIVRPTGWADLIFVTMPFFSFVGEPESDHSHDLGGLRDIEQYMLGMEHVIAGAVPALAVGGLLAVATRQTSEFSNGTPVPDMHFAVLRMLHACDLCYVASPVVRVPRRPAAVTEQGAWLSPSVTHVDVYRKVLR